MLKNGSFLADNIMTFVECIGISIIISIVILAIWGTWLGIQILLEALKTGHMSGMDALMLTASLLSILLAAMSVNGYWEKCKQAAERHNAVETKIRQAERDLDKKLNRMIEKEDWEKTE